MSLNLENIAKIKSDLTFEPVFISVSGAHLYGFESHNSDLDLRGCHLPVGDEFLRYSHQKDTFEKFWDNSPYFENELDIVSHSLLKYIHLISKQPNGYIMEQLFSPLVVITTELHQALQNLSKSTISKELSLHFGGFYKNQKRLAESHKLKEVKLVLYQARIIVSSAYLARTGQIQSNLILANNEVKIFDQSKISELVEIKKNGEKNNFPELELKEYWLNELKTKEVLIEAEFQKSSLPNFNPELVRECAYKLIKNFMFTNFKHNLRA